MCRLSFADNKQDCFLLPLLTPFTSGPVSSVVTNTTLYLGFHWLELLFRVALVLRCVWVPCAESILTWWNKINTADRILLPPSCFHSAALCILPPPFVLSPSTEGVDLLAAFSFFWSRVYWWRACTRVPGWWFCIWPKCFSERMRAPENRMRLKGSFGCNCLTNVGEKGEKCAEKEREAGMQNRLWSKPVIAWCYWPHMHHSSGFTRGKGLHSKCFHRSLVM